MRRQLICLALLLGGALTLSACDKCGGIQEIRYPKLPNACHGDAPAK